jgi:hypothetical protein
MYYEKSREREECTMGLSGTKRKTKEIKKKKASRLKNVSQSSKILKQSSKGKSEKKNKESKSLALPKKKKPLLSYSRGGKKSVESSPPGLHPGKKERSTKALSWKNKNWENEGWTNPKRVSHEEHLELTKAFNPDGKPKVSVIGRPKKSVDEKLNVKSLRLSLTQEKKYQAQAKKEGFSSWQAWIKKIAEERIDGVM